MHVLVAGCGWLGGAVGRSLVSRGDRVTGVRRSAAAVDAFRAAGIEPLFLDLADWHAARHLPVGIDAVVSCASAAGDTPEAYRLAYIDVNRTLTEYYRAAGVRAYVYTSSTGVFGQSDGGDVDEATAPRPEGATAAILVEAERMLLDPRSSEALHTRIVRPSGLYGPGRTGVIERVRRGELALGSGDQTWTNWCHLDDAVAVIVAALDRGRDGAVYHASDAEPARRAEVVTWIAERLAMDPPRRFDAPRGPGGRRGANRRVLSAATRAELGITLRFPSFRKGLAPFLPSGWPE